MKNIIRGKCTDERPIKMQPAAEMISIKKATLQKWVFERRFPFIRLSARALRFRVSDIQDFLNSRLVQPLDAKPSGKGQKKNHG